MTCKPHRADGLYAFSLSMLDAKGVFACNYGRAQFLKAVSKHTGGTASVDTEVLITAEFMELLERYFGGACCWFSRRMRELDTISDADDEVIHDVEDSAVVVVFLDTLYKRAAREGLIHA